MEMLTLLSIGVQFSQGHIFLIALTWAMTESPLPSRTGLKTSRHWPLSPTQEPPCWVRDWLGPEQTLYPDLPCLALAPKNSEANSKNRIGAMEKTWRKEIAFSTVHWMGLCLGVGSLWPPGVWPPECTGLKEQYSRTSQHRKWVLPCHEGKVSRVTKPPPHICLLITQVCTGIFCLVDWSFQLEEHFKSQENVESVFHLHNQIRKWTNTSFLFCLCVPSLDTHRSLTRGIGLN